MVVLATRESASKLQIRKVVRRPVLGACHLFIGILIGLVLYKHLGDKRLVALAALGALLPDLLDKPLGHLLLKETLDFGRIYCHTLLFCLSFILLGVVILQRKKSYAVLAVSLGIASHLILDSMWTLPVTLFYPFLGDFGPHNYPNYFEISLLSEILSPFEWLFLLLSIWIVLATYRSASSRYLPRLTSMLDRSVILLIILMAGVAISYVILAAAGIIPASSLESATMLSGIAVLGSIILAWMIKTDYAGTFKLDSGRRTTP